jgi:carbon-monoxide dehydrogenase medium subunit
LRAAAAEQHLRGSPFDEAAVNEAAQLAMSICEPVEDLRGNVEYKIAMAAEMTRRALHAAAKRAQR